MFLRRSILVAGLSLLTLGVGATTRGSPASGDAGQPPGIRATSQARAQPAYDPMAPVYILTSRATFDGGINRLTSQSEPARDAAGRSLVLSRLLAHQLDDVSRHIHERERRCGGYFAFASRAQALEFARHDRTLQAMQAQAVTYTIDNPATVTPWLAQVQELRIRDTIASLSMDFPNRYYASMHGLQSAQWIRDTWLALAHGRADVSVALAPCATCSTQPSVVMTVRGTTLADEIVVVGAHEDSISDSYTYAGTMIAPGADDDASGVAVMTEVIRIALAQGWRPQRTVKFMAYAAEEVGLRGSQALANEHRNANANVVGVLQLDMTNYAAGSTVAMRLVQDYSNPALQQFVLGLFDTYLAPLGLTRGTTACGYACSDHASWTAAGYPSAFMEEPTLFPRRHTPDDNLAQVGPTAAVSVNFAKLALAFVGELAKTAAPAGIAHDFNNDGRADVLFRNLGTGNNEIWRSGDSATKQGVQAHAINWKAAGIGDFNGDRKADVLWRDPATGAHDIWLSALYTSHLAVEAEPDLAWDVVGVGDFNGDTLADILWRHAGTGALRYWPSASRSANVGLATMADPRWQVAGVGDFDKDGRDDVFWRHRDSGANRIWRAADTSQQQAVASASAAWQVVAVADFNNDGYADIFMRSPTGANLIWRSANNNTPQAVTRVADTRWKVAQAGDFDGDGNADVLWRHAATGNHEVWRSARSDQRTTMQQLRDLNWYVIPMPALPMRRAFAGSR